MRVPSDRLLDEWRRPDRDVRIDVAWMRPLRDVSEQYVSPERSLLKLWTYLRRFGPWDALRKVRSRLSERLRNQKVAAFGFAVDGAEVSGVARGKLLLELDGEFGALDVVVAVLPRVSLMETGDGVFEIAECAVLRGALDPCAAAEIFRAGREAEPVAFK